MSELIFKVLSGLHKGAELPLSLGSYTIGSSDECDIILQDETVAARHCELKVAERLELTPLEGRVLVEGKELQGTSELEPLKVVFTGDVAWCVGKSGDKWPSVTMLQNQREEALTKQAKAEPRRAKQNRSSSGVLLAAAALLLVITAVSAFLLLSKPQNRHKAVTAKTEAKDIRELIKGHPSVKIVKGKRVKIVGYVKTDKEKWELYKSVKLNFPKVGFEVYSEEEMLSLAGDVASVLGLDGLSFSVSGGTIKVRGFVPDEKSLKKLVESLKRDVPGVQKVETDVYVLSNIKRYAEELLRIKGVTVSVKPHFIIISGTVSAQDLSRIKTAVNRIKERYRDVFKIEEKIRVIRNYFSLNVRAVHIGFAKYVILADGRKYFEGATLPGGYTLEKITPNKLVLVKDGRRHHYSIRR